MYLRACSAGKDWDTPVDTCIIKELQAVRVNQNLASIGLKL